MRQVGCHETWNIHKSHDKSIGVFNYEVFCGGHGATCGPRHHPVRGDTHSPLLKTVDESFGGEVGLGERRRRLQMLKSIGV